MPSVTKKQLATKSTKAGKEIELKKKHFYFHYIYGLDKFRFIQNKLGYATLKRAFILIVNWQKCLSGYLLLITASFRPFSVYLHTFCCFLFFSTQKVQYLVKGWA
jgi:hypothetical protein